MASTTHKVFTDTSWNKFSSSLKNLFKTLVRNTIKIDGVEVNSLESITHFGVCSTDASVKDKTVDCNNFSLEIGSIIIVKWANGNSADSPTLNVNSTGAKSIVYKGSNITSSQIAANSVYEFVYDGTSYNLVGNI